MMDMSLVDLVTQILAKDCSSGWIDAVRMTPDVGTVCHETDPLRAHLICLSPGRMVLGKSTERNDKLYRKTCVRSMKTNVLCAEHQPFSPGLLRVLFRTSEVIVACITCIVTCKQALIQAAEYLRAACSYSSLSLYVPTPFAILAVFQTLARSKGNQAASSRKLS